MVQKAVEQKVAVEEFDPAAFWEAVAEHASRHGRKRTGEECRAWAHAAWVKSKARRGEA